MPDARPFPPCPAANRGASTTPQADVTSVGVPQFVAEDCRVSALLIYSTAVPARSVWLGRMHGREPVGHRGRETAHALHEVCHGDLRCVRDHAGAVRHQAVQEAGRPEAARNAAVSPRLVTRQTLHYQGNGGGGCPAGGRRLRRPFRPAAARPAARVFRPRDIPALGPGTKMWPVSGLPDWLWLTHSVRHQP